MIRLLVLQILIIFLFLSSNSVASNQNIFEDAKIYFEKKDYSQSKFLFQKFLVFNPKDYLSYLYLAKIFKEVLIFKPKSSRKESKEIYIFCRNLKVIND